MKTFYLSIFVFLFNFTSAQIVTENSGLIPEYSELNGKTVSFSELMLAMESAKNWVIFKDIKVQFDYDIDKGGMDSWFVDGNRKFVFNAFHIGLYNCDFDEEFWMVLKNATFKGHFSMVGCTKVKSIMTNCTFEKSVRLNSNNFEFIKFKDCNFLHGFRFTKGEVSDNIDFDNCNFSLNENLIGKGGGFDMDDRLFYISNKLNGVDLTLRNCTFELDESVPFEFRKVDLSNSKYKNLILENNIFNSSLDIGKSIIEGYLLINHNEINSGILTSGLSYNLNNSKINWHDLDDHKISIFDGELINYKNFQENYSQERLQSIISSYTSIFNSYKSQGNREWANPAYIQWKDLETMGLKGEGKFMAYYLNKFLLIFSDYGTNPVKAIKSSIIVILIFSFIYLISPFERDKNQKSFSERYINSLNLAKGSNNLENVILQFSDNKIIKKFENNFIKGLNVIDKSKLNKSNNGVLFKATILILIFLNYAYDAIRKFLHSTILSINAFTTLGFGKLKVKGNFVYLTILEGFIGWFLLSIFIVTLINQIINW